MTVYDVVMAMYNCSNNRQSRIMIQCTEESVLGVAIGNFITLAFNDTRLLEVYNHTVRGIFVYNSEIAVEI